MASTKTTTKTPQTLMDEHHDHPIPEDMMNENEPFRVGGDADSDVGKNGIAQGNISFF